MTKPKPKTNPKPKLKRNEKSCDLCRSLKYKCNPLPPAGDDEAPQCERCAEAGKYCEYGDRGARRPSPLEKKVDTIIDILLTGGAGGAGGVNGLGPPAAVAESGCNDEDGRVFLVAAAEVEGKRERDPLLDSALEPMHPVIRDVVERGVLAAEEAEALLQRYASGNNLFPSSLIPWNWSAARLRVERPLLFHAVMAAALWSAEGEGEGEGVRMMDDLPGDFQAGFPRLEDLGMEKSWEREGIAALFVTVYALGGSSVVSETQREMFRYLTAAVGQLASSRAGEMWRGMSGHEKSGLKGESSFKSETWCRDVLRRLVPTTTEASVQHVDLHEGGEGKPEWGCEDDGSSASGSDPVTRRFERDASWDSGIWCSELEQLSPLTMTASVPNVDLQTGRKRKRGFGYEDEDSFIPGDVDGSMHKIDPCLLVCESATPVDIDVETAGLQGTEKPGLFEGDEGFHEVMAQWRRGEGFL